RLAAEAGREDRESVSLAAARAVSLELEKLSVESLRTWERRNARVRYSRLLESADVPPGRRPGHPEIGYSSHRGAGIRTRDLLLPKQARYRTAPHPVQAAAK